MTKTHFVSENVESTKKIQVSSLNSRSRHKDLIGELATILGLYGLFTIVLTYPLIFSLNSSIFGYTSDNFPTIWSFWANRFSSPLGVVDLVRYPLGEKLIGQLEIGWSWPFNLLSQVFGALVSFNLVTLFGFVLAGMAMYYLVKYLTQDKKISFLAGLIYTFSPFHFWQGFTHLSLGLLYTLPLYFLILLLFDKKRTMKWGVLLGLAFVFTFLTSLYFGYFVLITSLSYFGIKIIVKAFQSKNDFSIKLFTALVTAIMTVGILLFPILYLYLVSNNIFQSIGGLPGRPISDLLSLSMRPWDFILPPPNHPWWGNFSNQLLQIIQSKSNDFKTVSAFLPERINYVGFTTLVSVVVGLYFIFKRKRNREISIILLLLIFVLLIFSAPPFIIIHGLSIKFPTYLLYPFLTFFRVYARMGILVLMLLLLISSLGLAEMVRKSKFKNFLLLIVGLLVFVEFLPFGWGQTTSLKNQSVYSWLKDQPAKVIAEYPPDFDLADGVIWQMYHGKNLYNDFYGNELLPIKKELVNLYDPETWRKLKAVGVDLVILHTKYLYDKPHPINTFYSSEFAEAPFNQSSPEAEIVARFNNAIVYKPTTNESKVIYINQINSTYQWIGNSKWDLKNPENTIYIYNATVANIRVRFNYQESGEINEIRFEKGLVKQNQTFNLKKGLNSLVIKRAEKSPFVNITNFKLTIVN